MEQQKKVFVWVAHPRDTSLCGALAERYIAGARAAGAQVRRMDLSAMQFEAGAPEDAPLEADLEQWQRNVEWCDHLLVVHPYWWAAMPARAKAVLDRCLTSGFAYKYRARGVKWDQLLQGRSADGIITSDTPPWLDTLLYFQPGRRVLRNGVLGFCGFDIGKVVQFGSVKLADEGKIARWLGRAEQMGRKAAA